MFTVHYTVLYQLSATYHATLPCLYFNFVLLTCSLLLFNNLIMCFALTYITLSPCNVRQVGSCAILPAWSCLVRSFRFAHGVLGPGVACYLLFYFSFSSYCCTSFPYFFGDICINHYCCYFTFSLFCEIYCGFLIILNCDCFSVFLLLEWHYA